MGLGAARSNCSRAGSFACRSAGFYTTSWCAFGASSPAERSTRGGILGCSYEPAVPTLRRARASPLDLEREEAIHHLELGKQAGRQLQRQEGEEMLVLLSVLSFVRVLILIR